MSDDRFKNFVLIFFFVQFFVTIIILILLCCDTNTIDKIYKILNPYYYRLLR